MDMAAVYKELGEGAGMFIAAIIAGVVVLFRKTLAEKVAKRIWERLFPHELKEEMNRNKSVEKLMSSLLEETQADRAYVIQFQNGSVFSTKNPVWKLSMTYEVVGDGIAPTAIEFQDIKSSLVTSLISCFWDLSQRQGAYKLTPDYCKCASATSCKKPSGTFMFCVDEFPMQNYRVLFEKNGIKYAIWSPMLDGDQIVGFVGVDFCGEEKQALDLMAHATGLCGHATRASYELLK